MISGPIEQIYEHTQADRRLLAAGRDNSECFESGQKDRRFGEIYECSIFKYLKVSH